MDIKSLHEECGVFGVYNVPQASRIAYYGLHALQHRGQEGCGIVSVDKDGEFHRKRGLGLVTELFGENDFQFLPGTMSIGHVRYTTHGGGGIDNVQPFYFHHKAGDFALAHNGNIINSELIAAQLESQGVLFHTTSDSEIIAHLIKKSGREQRIDAIKDALNMLEGAFAFVIMTKNRIYVCRDKYGLRPLSIATLGDGYVVSSETCAFEVIGAKFLRDVEPGEVVSIDHHGLRSNYYSRFQKHKMCAMEYIYFARPDSDIEGCNVHAFRKESGRRLYRIAPTEADIVVGVPDSSLSAAMGYAEESGIPYEMGLIKSKYVGRTFIQPSQALREMGVKMKLSAVHSIVDGKRIVLIDDSIVRGTTSKKIVRLLREAGAKEVHVRIASSPLTHPCFYGVDITEYSELISARNDVESVRQIIGADSLVFLDCGNVLSSAPGRTDMCFACFTGHYPTSLYSDIEDANKNKKKF